MKNERVYGADHFDVNESIRARTLLILELRALRDDSSYNALRSSLAFSDCAAILDIQINPRWLRNEVVTKQ